MVIIFLPFWGTSYVFHSGCSNLHSYKSTKRSWFLLIFTSTCYLMFFGNSHPKRCEVICHWGFWFAFPWWSVILNTFSCTFWSSVCLLGRNKRWVWWCVHPLFWLTVCLSACKFSNTTYLQSLEKVSVLLSSHHSSQGSQVSYSVGPILRCPEVHGGNQEPYLTLLLATQDPGVFLPLNSIWILET